MLLQATTEHRLRFTRLETKVWNRAAALSLSLSLHTPTLFSFLFIQIRLIESVNRCKEPDIDVILVFCNIFTGKSFVQFS
jgi:hypothetical protein